MPTPLPPILTVNIGDASQAGLLENSLTSAAATLPRFMRNDGLRRRFRFVRPSDTPTVRAFDDVDLTGATITAGIGVVDRAPTSGTFAGSYLADATSLTGLQWNISAATLQTALNANTTIAGTGGVTVAKVGSLYEITWNSAGARSLLSWDVSGLSPRALADARRATVGDGSHREVQTLRLLQDLWAGASNWSLDDPGSIECTEEISGTSSKPAVFRVLSTPPAIAGAFQFNFGRAEVTRVQCVPNKGTQEIFIWNFTSNTSSDYGNRYRDVETPSGTVRVWWDIEDTGTPPAIPTDGRLLEVDIVSEDIGDVMALKTALAMIDDGAFLAQRIAANTIRVRINERGACDDQISGTCDVINPDIEVHGTNGPLDGMSFPIYDKDGGVGIWFKAGDDTEIPDEAASMPRSLMVEIDADDTAVEVATALHAVVNPDAQFSASLASSTVTITDAEDGPRTTASAGTSPLGVVRIVAGTTISATIPGTATADLFALQTGDFFNVTKNGPGDWTLTPITNGDVPTPEAEDATLEFPVIATAEFLLNGLVLAEAFAATTDEELDGVLEIKIEWPDETPMVVLHVDVRLARDLLSLAEYSEPLSSSLVRHGSVAITNGTGSAGVAVTFDTAFPHASWKFDSLVIVNTTDATPDNFFIGTVKARTAAGFTVQLSGDVTTANFNLEYICKLG